MKNFFRLLLLVGLLAVGWLNRDALRGISATPPENRDNPIEAGIPAATPAAPGLTTPDISTNSPPPATPPAPEQADPAELSRMYQDSIVFVHGGKEGNGFIANMGGRPFLLTHPKVAAGVGSGVFKTVPGVAVQPGPSSLAVGHDIFAMQIAPVGTPLEVMRNVDQEARPGDTIAVLTKTEVGGGINSMAGIIGSISPTTLETDVLFEARDIGSPIVHLKSRKVIGVVSYRLVRRFDAGSKPPAPDPVPSRVGYRIDTVKTWQPMNWPSFQASLAELQTIDKLTADLCKLLNDLGDDEQLKKGVHSNPTLRGQVDAWMRGKSKYASYQDKTAADQNFLGYLKSSGQSDITRARANTTYDYIQRQLSDHQSERAQVATVFAKIAPNVQFLR